MDGSGLWVYEGLTQYLGIVQAARAGYTPGGLQSSFNGLASGFKVQTGRSWRPGVDTARSVGILRNSGGSWGSERRGTDYYTEGALVWLEADCIIREGTGSKKSLNDFCRKFFGGVSDKPVVKPYAISEVVRDLNSVYKFDWAKFLHERIDLVHLSTPEEALERAGFRLVAGPLPDATGPRGGAAGANLPQLGLSVSSTGLVSAVTLDGPALKAGLRANLVIAKMDGAAFDASALTKKATTPGPGSVTFETAGGQKITVPFVGAPLGFHLEPIPGKKNYLEEIAKPLG